MASAQTANTSKKDYDSSDIQALEGREAVRKRPGMYIGNTGLYGLHHMVTEVLDNSIDEALAGFCDTVTMTIHYDNSVTITDNGRGIPVGLSSDKKYLDKSTLEVVLTVLHAGAKFENDAYQYSGGLHGVGVSCVNFLSEWMEVEVKREGKIHHMRFEKGVPKTKIKEIGSAKKTGTKVRFRPDQTIFDDITFNYEQLERRFRELAFLNPGITIFIEDERSGKSNEFMYEGGIVEFLKQLNDKRQTISKPIFFTRSRDINRPEGKTETIIAEVALQYTDSYSESLFCYANNIHNPDGGTHASGFRSALTRTLNQYGKKNDLTKKFKDTITGDDVREGLCAVISIKIPDPQFESQTKVKLLNPEVEGLVQKIVNEGLMEYLEENPSIAKRLINKVITAAEARIAARKARETVRKSVMDISALPGKLSDCSDKDPENTELFIVEGDSAGGPARQGRDRHYQAILPIKGKILNTERARLQRVLSNEEIRSMVTALGTGIGEGYFDLGKLRYGKVIIMTDADVDGEHISTLLLTFFYRHLPELVKNRNVYVALPPLFRIGKGKKSQYIQTQEEKDKFVMELGAQSVGFKINNDGNVTKELNRAQVKQLVESLYQMEIFSITVQRKGTSLRELIENRQDKTGKLATYLTVFEGEKKLWFKEANADAYEDDLNEKLEQEEAAKQEQMELALENGDVAQDFVKKKRHKIEKHEIVEAPELEKLIKFFERLGMPIMDYFEKSAMDRTDDEDKIPFYVTDKNDDHGVHSLVEAFEKIKSLGAKGLTIQRYKGLGEMNHDQLWETTMNPATRTLKLITLDDPASADITFSTLMGDVVESRRAFIQQHAPEVQNLDF